MWTLKLTCHQEACLPEPKMKKQTNKHTLIQGFSNTKQIEFWYFFWASDKNHLKLIIRTYPGWNFLHPFIHGGSKFNSLWVTEWHSEYFFFYSFHSHIQSSQVYELMTFCQKLPVLYLIGCWFENWLVHCGTQLDGLKKNISKCKT